MLLAGDRILDFADTPARLSMRHEQLVIERHDEPDMTVPFAEIAVLILSNPRISATQSVLACAMQHGASVLICDSLFQPTGLMLPLAAHSTQTQRMIAQAKISLPTCKRLWKQIVVTKIQSQATTLEDIGHDASRSLRELAKNVKSGDTTNLEAQAAARYWPALLGVDFRRRREREDANRHLNYGYAIVRACMGRAICAAGLHPSLGLHHTGKTNPWCLADDLMEPYRPLVDQVVLELVGMYGPTLPLDSESKRALMNLLASRVVSRGESRTVFEHMYRTASSLAAVFLGERRDLEYPGGLTNPSKHS